MHARTNLLLLAGALLVVGCTSEGCPRIPNPHLKPISLECDADEWLQSLAAEPLPAGIERSERSGTAVRLHFAGRAPAGEDEYEQLNEALILGFRELPGLEGSALRDCALGERDSGQPDSVLCMQLELRVCRADRDEIASFFRQRALAAGLEDVSFLVEIQRVGVLEPRCAAGDPECLPVPYGDGDPDDAPLWCEPRTPVGRPIPGGACAHDGDCLIDGCGNTCVAWTEAGRAGFCPGLPWLDGAYCGCVRGQCHWFE